MKIKKIYYLPLIWQYPKINNVTITTGTSLGNAIKYYVAWAIIFGAIIALGSLISSGIQYMVSAGNIGQQKTAKQKITNAFLGLFILLSSYLILETINPQITVLSIRKQAVKSGCLVFTEDGYNQYSSGHSLSSLLNIHEANYLGYGTEDTLKTFKGEYWKQDGDNCKFNKFPIKYLYFFDDNVRVYVYSKKNFKGKALVFDKESVGGKTKDISEIFNGEVEGANHQRYTCKHPPLSMRVEILLPGVYLMTNKLGEERYIGTNKSRLDGLLFDNKATAVEIRNKMKNSTTNDFDYLAALYEDDDYDGDFRLIFENKEREISAGTRPKKIVSGNATSSYSLPASFTDPFEGKVIGYIKEKGNPNGSVVYGPWGKVNGVSSVKTFRINKNVTACKEVMVCTEPNFQGDCLDYYLEGTKPTENNKYRFIATTTMSNVLFQTENLPDITHKIDTYSTSSSEKAYFAENIGSIKIRGNCLVGLFQNKKEDVPKKGFGEHSRLFKSSIADLSGYKTNSCGQIRLIGTLKKGHSCSKSIVIFPVER